MLRKGRKRVPERSYARLVRHERNAIEPAPEGAETLQRMQAAQRLRLRQGSVHHSNHGSQYASHLIGKTMRDAGVRTSTGSISSPWDSATMGSHTVLIKAECVHARTFETRERAAPGTA